MIDYTFISMDFYNENFTIKIEENHGYWDNADEFITATNFPFEETVRILGFEPQRNIFHIERPGGVNDIDQSSIEIEWLKNNLTALSNAAKIRAEKIKFVITLEMERDSRLTGSDWVVLRHNEESILGMPRTLTTDQIKDVLNYRQQLRDMTKTYDPKIPTNEVSWPTNPMRLFNKN